MFIVVLPHVVVHSLHSFSFLLDVHRQRELQERTMQCDNRLNEVRALLL